MSVNPWNDTMQQAITEAQARIRAVYPDAIFRLVEGEDPTGLYLDAYTDAEDAFAVLDVVSDWLLELSVNTGVHLHVIPLPKQAPEAHASSPPHRGSALHVNQQI